MALVRARRDAGLFTDVRIHRSHATDGVSRSLRALWKGTPDGDCSLSVRLGVTREAKDKGMFALSAA